MISRDRSQIARMVLWVYSLTIAAAFLYLLIHVPGVVCDDNGCKPAEGSWVVAVKAMSELITTAILPIVTLVLGFYFGSEKTAR